MIGRNGERRSGISAQAARHDDDIYIYIRTDSLKVDRRERREKLVKELIQLIDC